MRVSAAVQGLRKERPRQLAIVAAISGWLAARLRGHMPAARRAVLPAPHDIRRHK